MQQFIIILMSIEPETLQILLTKKKQHRLLPWFAARTIFLHGAHHDWKNLLRHAGELADATDE